ncbi:7362_t:CDS:10 [Ambispora leptoticha]|uniref:histone deacetylase n=1 Tax=Ambispora leptoticha TaxID=144679 RepID=A0A9N8VHD6_9GLOM|nr:7362_t:CDS:10 [Ambispora leptoticha]
MSVENMDVEELYVVVDSNKPNLNERTNRTLKRPGLDSQTTTNGIEKYHPQPFKESRTGFVYDIRMRYHGNLHEGEYHPEDPSRISGIAKILETYNCTERLVKIPAREATKEEVCLVHSVKHWNEVDKTAGMKFEQLVETGDQYNSVYLNNDSAFCARLACGGVIELCKAVMQGTVTNGFANVRPPGHHAEPEEAMGFCLFNNVAVTAKCLREYHHVNKILILDWDIHHGNGTQKAFYNDPNVVYCSIHRYENGEFYPGSEQANYTYFGSGEAKGKTINIPWPRAGMYDSDYIYAFDKVVMPIADEFSPDIVIVSAGFDAAEGDPIGENHVSPIAFGHMTHRLKSIANGRLVLALEGGYNIDSISRSALACVKVLLGEAPDRLPPIKPSKDCMETVHNVLRVQSRYWKSLAPEHVEIAEGMRKLKYYCGRKGCDQDMGAVIKERTLGKIAIDMTEMLKAYRVRYLYETFRMVPAPISNDHLKKFNQITCSQNLFTSNIIFIFVHETNRTWQVSIISEIDSSLRFIDTITKQDCAIIDIDFSPSNPGDSQSRHELNELLLYVWDNMILHTAARHVFLLGAGIGCASLTNLITEREPMILDRVGGVIMVPSEIEVPKVGRGTNLIDWYYEHSCIFVPGDHPYWDKKQKSKVFGRCKLPVGNIGAAPVSEILDQCHQEIFRYVYTILAGEEL